MSVVGGVCTEKRSRPVPGLGRGGGQVSKVRARGHHPELVKVHSTSIILLRQVFIPSGRGNLPRPSTITDPLEIFVGGRSLGMLTVLKTILCKTNNTVIISVLTRLCNRVERIPSSVIL